SLHTEIEQGLFPRDAFGFTPVEGDRALERGAWIFDCGHPPYETEMHPPTFLAFGHGEGEGTTALAFVNPYRTTQLFNPDPALATGLGDDAGFTNAATLPFPKMLVREVLRAVTDNTDHLEAHGLIQATRFSALAFRVCAPAPRPPGAALVASWRF